MACPSVCSGDVSRELLRAIATHLVKQAGQTHQTARTDSVTTIQRFGSALNLTSTSTGYS
jgi:hypothetical protein